MKPLVFFLAFTAAQANAALTCEVQLGSEHAVFGSSKPVESINENNQIYLGKVSDYTVLVRETSDNSRNIFFEVKSSTAVLIQSLLPSPITTSYGKSSMHLLLPQGILILDCR